MRREFQNLRLAVAAVLIGAGCVATAVTGQARANTGTVSGVTAGTDSQVLILGSSVSGGGSSVEGTAVTTAGLTPVVVDDATWLAMTTADFATYRAIVIGDPTCGLSGATPQVTAQNSAATWAPALDGNVIINGTDPAFHSSSGGGDLTTKSVAFASAQTGKTGAYLSLSCYYDNADPAGEVVGMLAGVGSGDFVARQTASGCYNSAHIVATHPSMTGLTDAALSNWSCSVHEEFKSWPADFTVLAIAQNSGSAFTASDGTVGTPYILARGAGLITAGLSVDPSAQDRAVTETAAVTASLVDGGGAPVVGAQLRARVASGPNAGTALACSPCTTNAAGQVQLSYPGTVTGVDGLQVWREITADGVPTSGEPNVTAAVTWGDPAVVGKPSLPEPTTRTCMGKPATIVGTPNAERIVGTPGPDVIVGGSGDDVILGGSRKDLICGNRGKDLIRGGRGDDALFGGHGADRLYGGRGSDKLRGGEGRDQLDGGPGGNSLAGGPKPDSLNGGPGQDRCTDGDRHDDVSRCERIHRG